MAKPPRAQPGAPALRGMACQVAEAEIKALKTPPPKPYTQGELVKSMKGWRCCFVTRPAPETELKDTTDRHRQPRRHAPTSSPWLIARGCHREERTLHPRIGCGIHVDRRRARGDCRREPPPCGTGARHDRGRTAHRTCSSASRPYGFRKLDRSTAAHRCPSRFPRSHPQCGAPTRQRTGKRALLVAVATPTAKARCTETNNVGPRPRSSGRKGSF